MTVFPVVDLYSGIILQWLGWSSLYACAAFAGIALLLRTWRRAPAAVVHLCWWLVFLRLILPAGFTLPFSVGSLLPARESADQPAVLVSYPFGEETAASVGDQLANADEPAIRWNLLLVSLWGSGALTVLAWLSWRRRRFTTLLRDSEAVKEPAILDMLDRCSDELGIRRRVRLVHGEGMVSPFTAGVIRPVIWIPTPLLNHLDESLLRCLLAHELVHVARFDDLFIRFQLLIQSLFFFHPLAWIAGTKMDRSREQACDEHVVAVMNVPSRDYGRSLIETLRFNLIPTTPLAGFGAGRKRSLEMRLRALPFVTPKSRLTLLIPMMAAWLLLPLSGPVRAGGTIEPSTPAPRTDAVTSGILRVGGDIKAPRVLNRVEPQYSAEALKARVQGIVILEALIDENGRVNEINVLKGLPFGLNEAAMEAVRQWKFEPALHNGIPAKVLFNVTINFKLKGPDLSTPLPGGRLTSGFAEARGRKGETLETHSGVDLAAPHGTAVLAAGDGEVIIATMYDAERSDSGTFVIIDHGDEIKTFYSHLDTLAVTAGQRVRTGESIGTVGTTGVTSGPHLHFEVWSADQPVDPSLVKGLRTNR